MNWLAHIFLSENSIDYQLGNLLADPLKGKCWSNASIEIQKGFTMHKGLDSFTDSNTYVHRSKSRLGKKGYLKGIVIDITYDYLLLNNWEKYSTIPVSRFIENFYDSARAGIIDFPPEARDFVERVIRARVLTSYSEFSGLEKSFSRIDKRLSPRVLEKDTATRYLPLIKDIIEELEKDFLHFFPQLIDYTKSNITIGKNHWLR